MRIVFLGTPDFAVGTLAALLEAKKNVVAVVTMPDKPSGRGKKLQQSAVKKFALEHNLPVLQPTNLKDPAFQDELRSYQAEIQIVVAFRMLPISVWDMPPLGTFNLHASLLPQYRGAAPINWAIINGEKKTGVTTFFLKHEIDTGNILMQQEVGIEEDDNVGTLHDKLLAVGAKLVVETMDQIEAGNIEGTPQEDFGDEILKPAPKIFKPDCRINWDTSIQNIHNKVRGLNPYPAASTRIRLGDKELGLKIYSTTWEPLGNASPGTVEMKEKVIGIQSTDGILWIEELQLEGKRRMKTEDFLRGVSEKIEIVNTH
ncbi:MAG: methionyl-tRNA formyltransferase [Crocinitomicaceae bacterium]|mgnify:CR=1 FL=1|nr:methionyl-tRNA formyltransferase [Crocinitomicaceae bacterium]|tara:strand:- start:4305 stop:5249 length:945 start_codon:yes stop_codon:yes gene_type:complete